MRSGRTARAHAARVAASATIIVLAVYVVAVLVLNVVVDRRLTHEADVRLGTQLSQLHPADLTSPTGGRRSPDSGRGDVDDAPTFVWTVDASGRAHGLDANSPSLPTHAWASGPVTLDVGSTPFRFRAERVAGQLVVAGQSLAEVARVQGALEEPEIALGLVLLVAVFAGALVIGLRASAPVEEVRRRQAEFTADASHELRTPLSVIEAEVELALSRPRDAPDYEVVLGRIGAEGHRLRRIVDDLLWLARTDAARDKGGQLPSVDVAAVAAACTERFGAVSERRGVSLSFVDDGGRCIVLARAEDIDRLTGVLVDNACKHAGTSGRVEVRVHASGTRVGLEVNDSGSGIPEDQVPFIFDRFHRATETTGGTGLGLAIADAIVRSTRGTWAVGRSPLGGARMAVSWRRAPRQPSVSSSAFPPTRRSSGNGADSADPAPADGRRLRSAPAPPGRHTNS